MIIQPYNNQIFNTGVISSKLTHPIFKDFTQTELDYLLKIAKTVTFEKNSIIIHEGDLGREIYVILDGQVDVTKESGIPGEVIDLITLGPGSVLGEIAVITNRPRSAIVTTLKNTTVLLLNIATIKQDTNAKSIYEKLLQNLTVERRAGSEMKCLFSLHMVTMPLKFIHRKSLF